MRVEVYVKCPRHNAIIPVVVKVKSREELAAIKEAEEKLIGTEIECLYYPPHKIRVTRDLLRGARIIKLYRPRKKKEEEGELTAPTGEGVVRRYYTTTEIGEHIWTLTKTGKAVYREIMKQFKRQLSLLEIPEEAVETVKCPICGAEIPEHLYEYHVKICKISKTGLKPARIPPPKREKPAKPRKPPVIKYMWVIFKTDIPEWMAPDFKNYGPYRKGDVAKIPESDAKRFIEAGMAEPFQKPRPTAEWRGIFRVL